MTKQVVFEILMKTAIYLLDQNLKNVSCLTSLGFSLRTKYKKVRSEWIGNLTPLEVRELDSQIAQLEFTISTTPKPTDPNVWVRERTNYTVVAIQFSGLLSDSNIEEHTKILKQWVIDRGYTANGKVVSAGYNGPFTLPMFRRNEVLMEVIF